MDLIISNAEQTQISYPVVEEGIRWTTERKGSPGQLTFSVIDDGSISFEEGCAVKIPDIFFGYVFTIKATQENKISVTAYDQIRYLKNKDTKVYENLTAGELLNQILQENEMNQRAGTIADTKWKIATRTEDNVSYMDMIQNALDETVMNTGELYVMYDEMGKINLKLLSDMFVPILIDKETAQTYDYQSSIDSDTYNKIKLYYDNEDTGLRDVYIAQDSANINKWGILQYFESIDKNENGQAKADSLLKLYNQKTRNLSIKGCAGDIRVRGGSLVGVQLNLFGNVKLQQLMLVEKAVHNFDNGFHTMDLNLAGGGFSA